MSGLLTAWVLFPALLLALTAGCGLLVERAIRTPIPGALIPGVGLAVIVVTGQFLALSDATAELMVPVTVVLAAGRASSSGSRGAAVRQAWAWRRAVAVFAVFAAPIVALRRGDDRRLHQARRHRHLAGADRPRDRARPQPRGPGAFELRGDASLQPRRRLPGRRLPAARDRRQAARRGHRLARPALHGLLRRAAGAGALGAGIERRQAPCACGRSSPFSRRSRRCSSATTSGAGSRSWPPRR